MGEETSISWCDATFNIVWGCTKVSEACKFCYAETFAKRVGLKVWGQGADRRIMSDSYWKAPLAWNAKALRRNAIQPGSPSIRPRVFCSSMADVFEDHPIVESQRARLWPLIAATPALDWLLLTKRPENMPRMAPLEWASRWPSNIWVGTTVENQARADERIPHLLQVPARIRFLSCEPMLEAIDLAPYLAIPDGLDDDPHAAFLMHEAIREGRGDAQRKLSWVISGGESGPGARPVHPAWARSLRDQCVAAGVPFLFKQWGEWFPRKQSGLGAGSISTWGTLEQDGQFFPSTTPWNGHDDDGPNTGAVMLRVGKGRAGCMLDGAEYHEWPESAV